MTTRKDFLQIQERKQRSREEFRRPRFAQGEIVRAAGCSKAMLTNVIARFKDKYEFDYLEPDAERGRIRRLFSMRDAVILAVVSALDVVGVAAAAAVKHGVQIADELGSDDYIIHLEANFAGLWADRDQDRNIAIPYCYVVDSEAGNGRLTKGMPGTCPTALLTVNVSAIASTVARRLAELYEGSGADWERARQRARTLESLQDEE